MSRVTGRMLFRSSQRRKESRIFRAKGFTKKSDPNDVKKAMDAAKAAGEGKRYRALRGLLKVIKRGGAMMWIWVDISLIELEQMLLENARYYEV